MSSASAAAAAPIPEGAKRLRRPTTTARFGSSRRESHDASAFYERFVPPETSSDDQINAPAARDVIYPHDARDMSMLRENSVALVVTSPPYFAGKEYEEALGEGGIPATYLEYLAMLRDVFEQCRRVLEPGGRMAVNVANLGRRPYRSLSADVIAILQDDLGLLLRGEVIWWKGKAAGGSCAWGTFQRPGNPVLRDVTERVIIASKGRFDRALIPKHRLAHDQPSTATISRDEFLEATTDLWEIPPESATRVGHPAPFPLALPKRLIELYTYQGDLVLDPFLGSGTTAVAALRTFRHFVGFETDPSYITTAEDRIERERALVETPHGTTPFRVELPAIPEVAGDDDDFQARAVKEGRKARELAEIMLTACGFDDIRSDVRLSDVGLEVSFLARDQVGGEWAFDVSGAFTSNRAGLRRTDTLWKALGKASVLHAARDGLPLVLLTTDAPPKGTAGHKALEVVRGPGKPVHDLIELLNPDDQARLHTYAVDGRRDQ